MGRIARLIIPDCPHHVIQRGNRRQRVFFYDSDRELYLRLLSRHAKEEGLVFLAYCLMENHVHFIAIPHSKESLARGFAETHRKYTTIINVREDWRGYLWQGRFLSYPLDDCHLYSAIRYVEKNPVRANLVKRAEDYPWSSARAHVHKSGDQLLSEIDKFLKIENWRTYLEENESASDIERIKMHTRTGRPLGDENFIEKLENLTGRDLRPLNYGHKRGHSTVSP